MDLPKVSVVIPTYNRAVLVTETVKAVLNQSYRNIEVIVVSDGGTDDTDEELKKLSDERLKFIQMERHIGLASIVRNVGIKNVTGEFIAFCDDDDIWMQGKLIRQLREFEEDEKLIGVATNMILYPDRKLNSYFLLKSRFISYLSLLQYGNPLATSTMLIRRDILDKIGLFDESSVLKICQDWDLWLRILKYQDKSIKLLKSSWVKYRVDNLKLTTSDNYEVEQESAVLKYIYTKHLPKSEDMLKRILNEAEFNRIHSIRKYSRLLYYGIVSPWHILIRGKFSIKDKFIILGKYSVKYIYYYINKIY